MKIRHVLLTGALCVISLAGVAAEKTAAADAPNSIEVSAQGSDAAVSIAATHSRVDRIVKALGEETGRRLEVDQALSYKRLHLFCSGIETDRLTVGIARISGAEWQAAGGSRRLAPTNEARDRARELRRKHPDQASRKPTPPERLKYVDRFSAIARDPAALASIARAQPELARQLTDPLVQSVAGSLSILQPYQKLLVTGRHGLTLTRKEFDPDFDMRTAALLRKDMPGFSHVNGIQIRLAPDGGLQLLFDVAEADGLDGNSVIIRNIQPLPQGGPNGPAASDPKKPDSLPALPRVEPRKFLVPTGNGQLPYRYAESLERLAEAYRVHILSEVPFWRPDPAEPQVPDQQAFRALLEPSLPIGECFQALSRIFGLEYEHRDGIHYLRNPRWYWEEKYAHTDEEITRVSNIRKEQRHQLRHLATLLDVGVPQTESLSLVFPELHHLVANRDEVQLYASLSPEQQQVLAQRGRLSVKDLSPVQQRVFWAFVGLEGAAVPEEYRQRFSLEFIGGVTRETLTYRLRP